MSDTIKAKTKAVGIPPDPKPDEEGLDENRDKVPDQEEAANAETPPAEDAVTPEEVQQPEAKAMEQPEEPYGAQVLRRLHEDGSLLSKDYDRMVPLLENPAVKDHLTEHLGQQASHLGKTENLFNTHYSHLPGLAGAMGKKDLPANEEEAVGAASGNPKLPPAEEAVQGMEQANEGDEDEIGTKAFYASVQAIRLKYSEKGMKCSCGKTSKDCTCGKKAKEDGETKEESNQESSDEEKPGKKPAKSEKKGKKKSKKDDGQDPPPKADSEATEPDQSGGPETVQDPSLRPLEAHEKAKTQEACGFLQQLGDEQNWGEEHRMKSYHYHKSLDPIGVVDSMTGGMMGGTNSLEMSNGYGGKAMVDPTLPQPASDPPGSPGTKAVRVLIKELANFFGELSRERAFGEPHRVRSRRHFKAMEPHLNTPDAVPPPDGEMVDGEEDEDVHPAEMGDDVDEATDVADDVEAAVDDEGEEAPGEEADEVEEDTDDDEIDGKAMEAMYQEMQAQQKQMAELNEKMASLQLM